MTPSDSTSFHTVSDARQAQLLTEPKSKAFLKPFLAAERSATEAAKELGCELNTLLYRVNAFLDAGLLDVTKTLKRKGRAVKYYRSVHDAYFVPFTLTPYATLEERLGVQGEPIFADLIRSYASALRQNERYGNYLSRTSEGAVVTTDAIPELLPSGLPVVYSDTVVSLSKSEAVALAEALRALFQHGVETEHGSVETRDYFFMVALLPLAR